LEPETYQTEIVTRIFTTSGKKTERNVLSARNGMKRLTIFNLGEKDEFARLELSPDQIVSVYRDKKIYAENTNVPANSVDAANDFLTTEWLNQKTPAAFENLGKENGLLKFRTKLGDAGENANSEVVIYFDENLKLPVKQEFFSVAGEQKTLTFTVELKNFKTQIDDTLFEIPKDYRKISPKEFQEAIWKERTKDE
jgi:outer membrane lipoprotein-sorting protein